VANGDEYRPLSWVIAVALGYGSVNFITGKMEDIAQKLAATKA